MKHALGQARQRRVKAPEDAPQGTLQGTHACAHQQPAEASVCELPSYGQSDKASTAASTIWRKPYNDKGFKPSWRLSETTGQRSVSALRVAFLRAQVTERRERSKSARALCTLYAPRSPDCRRRSLAAGPTARGGESFAHVTAPHKWSIEAVARKTVGVVSPMPGWTVVPFHTLRTSPHQIVGGDRRLPSRLRWSIMVHSLAWTQLAR